MALILDDDSLLDAADGFAGWDDALVDDTLAQELEQERAAELEGRPNSPELKKILVKKDQKRETYYKQYTGHPMGLYKNYTICLDTGTLGVENCIDILCTLLTENA